MRGWGPADFEHADPVFLDAIHAALFAEAMGPILTSVEEILNMDLAHLPAPEKAKAAKAKLNAQKIRAPLRVALMLDEEGDG